MVATNRSRRPPAHPARARRPLPDIDERLVMPETRYEVIDGKVEYVAPSDPLHGSRHSKVSAIIEACAARGFEVASDMLTRTSEKNDVAPDVSVFPRGKDPRTGGRRLEVLAFEVVSTQRLSHAAKKARTLSLRGVRQVFALDVKRQRVLVWSKRTDAWELLPRNGIIEDPALVMPLPVRSLVEAELSDDAVAEALLAKGNPFLVARERASEEHGIHAGLRQAKVDALLTIIAARGWRLTPARQRQLRAEHDLARLNRWIGRAVSASRLAAIFRR